MALQESAESCGVPCVTWDKMLEFGKSNPADATPGDKDSLCTIMYTSGTTGDPKGVEISHRAVLATVGALARLLEELKLKLGCVAHSLVVQIHVGHARCGMV